MKNQYIVMSLMNISGDPDNILEELTTTDNITDAGYREKNLIRTYEKVSYSHLSSDE